MARKGRWKENRTRRPRQHRQRRTGGREDRQRFLIVCEGQETEPQYFRRFRVPGHVQGFGISPFQLVNKALELKTQDEYDQLAAKQELAITHAEKLLAQYSFHNPANEDPSATVHRLVIELNNSLTSQRE